MVNKMMRKLLIVCLMALLVLPLNAQTDDDSDETILDVLDTLQVPHYPGLPDLEGRVVRVAVENAYPPFNFVNSEGRGEGWDYDVVPELCDRLNCQVEFVEMEWEGVLDAVADGTVDMAADGITVTAERAERMEFSDPYIILRQVFLVRSTEDRFDTIQAFVANDDLQISTQMGTTNAERAIELLGEDTPRLIASESDVDGLVLALISFETDAVIMDSLVAQRYLNEYPEAVRVFEEPLSGEEALGFPFTPGSGLVEPFNMALDTMREDGSLAALNTLWLFGFDE
jgi:polar amino acid transport system substrate-binding protein